MIELSLNDDIVTFDRPLSLGEAMEHWGYTDRRCAVAINGEFVPRSEYASVTLKDRDEVDVVAPVGGG